MRSILDFLMDEEGATAVEYALMLALIAVIIIAAVTILGQKVQNTFTEISGAMPETTSG